MKREDSTHGTGAMAAYYPVVARVVEYRPRSTKTATVEESWKVKSGLVSERKWSQIRLSGRASPDPPSKQHTKLPQRDRGTSIPLTKFLTPAPQHRRHASLVRFETRHSGMLFAMASISAALELSI